MGGALSAVKEALHATGDGGELVHVFYHRVDELSSEQLAAWRLQGRRAVADEARRQEAVRAPPPPPPHLRRPGCRLCLCSLPSSRRPNPII